MSHDLVALAQRARIHLSAEEAPIFDQQMGAILRYIEILDHCEVGEVPPLLHPGGMPLRWRTDIAADCDLLIGSPADTEGFRVPSILDEEL